MNGWRGEDWDGFGQRRCIKRATNGIVWWIGIFVYSTELWTGFTRRCWIYLRVLPLLCHGNYDMINVFWWQPQARILEDPTNPEKTENEKKKLYTLTSI